MAMLAAALLPLLAGASRGGDDDVTGPGTPVFEGSIAFASDRGGEIDIWVLDLEGGAPFRASDSSSTATSNATVIFRRWSEFMV